MGVSDRSLSRTIAHALRHEPWLYELELDDKGWVPVEQLLTAVREKGGAWGSVDRESLERMLATASKQRYDLDGDRIRALYGHSVAGRIHKRRAAPPERLFHGTPPEAWQAIRRAGLLPMGRQFVHLSVDRATAVAVGGRRSARPVILEVRAAAAAGAGVAFYEGNDLVWLADAVPPQFLHVSAGPH